MLNIAKIEKTDDYFTDLGKRRSRCAYFCRINGYSRQIHDFILKYHESARTSGVIIEGNIRNPDNKNLEYYNEIMGMDFQLDRNFIRSKLNKWLPRMSMTQCDNVAYSIYDTLVKLKNSGKNEGMLKNAYIRFMCWLYYKFERIVNRLGDEQLPKILYEGYVTSYELFLLNMLASAGCDILLLQYKGDAQYKSTDPSSAYSFDFVQPDMKPFPQDFCLKSLRQEIQENMMVQRLYGTPPDTAACTNAWITGKIFDDLRTAVPKRGSDPKFFYNCFCLINGAEDKLIYPNELFRFYSQIKNSGRRITVVSGGISAPDTSEINSIQRKNYQKNDQLILDFASKFSGIAEPELQKLVRKAFIDTMMSESKKENSNMSRLTTKAVYILCWFNRYHYELFKNYRMPEISCFILFNSSMNENEAMFCRFLSKLPVDVVILNPNLNNICSINADDLYTVSYEDSLVMDAFPDENTVMRVGTAAYHAERELDTMMYTDTGMYRDRQYSKANTILLHTMYEEIEILWDKELTFRPSFDVVGDTVNMPVIFAKVSGVKNGDVSAYWNSIRKLVNDNTILVTRVPRIPTGFSNPMKQFATGFINNGKLQRQKIKEHKLYPYKFLRDSVQDYILDKLQLLLDRKPIKGMFVNGTEYDVISTVLNLDKMALRLIQNFDFTKTNPKLIYIITSEAMLSPEDTIYFSFLSLVGFDVLFFVPTGYQCFEGNLIVNNVEEHQTGEYKYDMRIPNLNPNSLRSRLSRYDKLFKRGT
ncbi:MAG: hypothetical protein IJ666_05400 [Ruminococcus sp.]|nr:hypothetical protein [Ruminococcus sp.]